VKTSDSYAHIQPRIPKNSLRTSLKNLKKWHTILRNDFEPQLFNKTPLLADIKLRLYKQGAFYASMSGSGSAIYGLFENPPAISAFQKYECVVRSLGLPSQLS
jgi:4-diphosphocytidyl-2-C-methyl-D-erythritol kinase